MTVAAIKTPQGGCLTFVAEAFTGDLTTAISAQLAIAATDRLWVKSWRLVVTANTAVCPIQLKGSTTGTYATDRAAAISTALGAATRTVFENPPGCAGFTLVAGEELVIGGGGTAGVLDGVVFYEVVPA